MTGEDITRVHRVSFCLVGMLPNAFNAFFGILFYIVSRSTYNCAARNIVLLMKTNITLKLDADLLREARVLAAEEDTSISAMLAARLEQIVRERKTYQQARKRALARLREGMDLRWNAVSVPRRDSRTVSLLAGKVISE